MNYTMPAQEGGPIRTGRYETSRDAPVQQIEKPRLAMQLDQLERVLQECHGITSNLDNAASRLLGPVPETDAKTEGHPPINSVEQRFAQLIGVAEGLASRLSHTSKRLNSAV